MVAAVDCAFRARIKTGHKPPEAYARSVAEIAKINALVEGYTPEVRRIGKTLCTKRHCAKGLMIQCIHMLSVSSRCAR